MENKKLSILGGAALALFSAGLVHASQLTKTQDLSGTILLAEEEAGCAGKDGGCGGNNEKKENKAKTKEGSADGEHSNGKNDKKKKTEAAQSDAAQSAPVKSQEHSGK